MRLELGTPVRCGDVKLGELADVVIDPINKRITHLVVRAHGSIDPARLVPIELVDRDEDRDVCLRCSIDEARRLEPVEDFAYLQLDQFPVNDPKWDVGVEHVLAMPYYQTGEIGGFANAYDQSIAISYDRVPKGEVEIRRSSSVSSADGELVGRVDGFLVDADDQITHLVLERGHLWRKREVTIPIGAVTKVENDSVTVSLSTRELGELPTVPVRRWRG